MATRRIEPSHAGMTIGTPAAGESKVIEVLPSIPGYTVTRKLGRGGMGVVYLAVQEGLERLVAIKMLPQGSEAERHLESVPDRGRGDRAAPASESDSDL